MSYFTFFLFPSLWNLAWIVHLEHIPVWIAHIPSAQEPYVNSDWTAQVSEPVQGPAVQPHCVSLSLQVTHSWSSSSQFLGAVWEWMWQRVENPTPAKDFVEIA